MSRVPIAPLPDDAVRRPLLTAALRELGVSRREIDGPLWQRLGRGVHAWHGLAGDDPDLRIQTVGATQPSGAVIGGWAALRALGVTALDGRSGPGSDRLVPVLVHVGPRGRSRPTPTLHVDRGVLRDEDLLEHDGLLVMRPTAACVSIARRYGVEEGLVAADAAVGAGLTCADELRGYVARRRGTRGIPAARTVADLVDGCAASPPESRLRFVWVVEAGLPRPLVNPSVVTEDGVFVGKPDLLGLDAGLVAEYDGAHHRDLRQHTADNAREEGFERLNLVVVRATALDLWPRRPDLVRRLRWAHRQGTSRDRGRDRWGLRPDR